MNAKANGNFPTSSPNRYRFVCSVRSSLRSSRARLGLTQGWQLEYLCHISPPHTLSPYGVGDSTHYRLRSFMVTHNRPSSTIIHLPSLLHATSSSNLERSPASKCTLPVVNLPRRKRGKPFVSRPAARRQNRTHADVDSVMFINWMSSVDLYSVDDPLAAKCTVRWGDFTCRFIYSIRKTIYLQWTVPIFYLFWTTVSTQSPASQVLNCPHGSAIMRIDTQKTYRWETRRRRRRQVTNPSPGWVWIPLDWH